MMQQLHDKTGAPVTITLDTDRPISAYTVTSADGTTLGRADFLDSPEAEGERVFFHTEVDQAASGRGLGGLLVRAALADSMRTGVTVVPVCPLFAGHLKKHGDEFVADGGAFRKPTRADIALVTHATQRGA